MRSDGGWRRQKTLHSSGIPPADSGELASATVVPKPGRQRADLSEVLDGGWATIIGFHRRSNVSAVL